MCRTEVWWSRPNSPSPTARSASGRRSAIVADTREQRCWVHKTANILNKLPKSQQPKAKRSLQEIWMAATSKDAEAAFDAFIAAYSRNTIRPPRAGEGSPGPARILRFPGRALETPADLEPDREHLRHRAAPHDPLEGLLSNRRRSPWCSSWSMRPESWRRLDGHNQLPKLIQGVRFTDGIEVAANPASSNSNRRRLIPQAITKSASPRTHNISASRRRPRRVADRYRDQSAAKTGRPHRECRITWSYGKLPTGCYIVTFRAAVSKRKRLVCLEDRV